MDVNDWESLHRDEKRGFEVLGRAEDDHWSVEVRFDSAVEPKQGTASDRQDAIKVGQELAMTAL